MPRYDYKCHYGHVTTEHRQYEHRENPIHCPFCEQTEVTVWAYYQFPLTAIKGFQPFEAYYDEALGCDVSGRRERKQIMVAEGLQEAGDKVGGARNFDKHAPDHIKPRPVKGRSYSKVKEREAEQVRLTPAPDIRGE